MRCRRSVLQHLLLTTFSVTIIALNLASALGAKPPKDKPGSGGGGDDGAGDNANPAFVYADPGDGGLFLTTSDGAAPTRVTNPPRGGEDSSPVFSPDLDGDPSNGYQGEIAFVRTDNEGNASIHIIKPDGSGESLIYDFGGGVGYLPITWSPDGKNLVFLAGFEVTFVDALTGNVEKFQLEKEGWEPSFSMDVAPGLAGYQGYLAFVQSSADGADIVLLDINIAEDGTKTFGTTTTLDLPNSQEAPHWSPTELSIVYTTETPITSSSTQTDVGVIDVGFDINDGSPIIIDGELLAVNVGPFPLGYSWSPDGIHVAWESPVGNGGSFEIVRIRADGLDNGIPTPVTNSRRIDELSPNWFPGWLNDIDAAP